MRVCACVCVCGCTCGCGMPWVWGPVGVGCPGCGVPVGVGCPGCGILWVWDALGVGTCGRGMPWVWNVVLSFSCSGAPRVTAALWRSWPPWGRCMGTGPAGVRAVLAPAPAEEVWSPGDGSATTPGAARGALFRGPGRWLLHVPWRGWGGGGPPHLSPMSRGPFQTCLWGACVRRCQPAGHDVQPPGRPASRAG